MTPALQQSESNRWFGEDPTVYGTVERVLGEVRKCGRTWRAYDCTKSFDGSPAGPGKAFYEINPGVDYKSVQAAKQAVEDWWTVIR